MENSHDVIWIIIAAMYAPLFVASSGKPGGSAQKPMCFLFCTLTLILAIPATPVAIITWIVAWSFALSARNARQRHAMSQAEIKAADATLRAIQEQNAMLRQQLQTEK